MNYSKERIDDDANAFAKQHKLKKDRLRKVFHKMANCTECLSPDVPYYYPFIQSILFVKPTKALEIFEKADLDSLNKRVQTFFFFFSVSFPFIPLKDLACLTEQFITHLQGNKTTLIETGHPQTRFKNKWMDWYLNKLYYTKLPFLVKSSPLETIDLEKSNYAMKLAKKTNIFPDLIAAERAMKKILIHDFLWINKPINMSYGYNNITKEISFIKGFGNANIDDYLVSTISSYQCRYEDAPLVKGLRRMDADKIERMREKLFDTIISILQSLIESIQSQNVNKLWNNCLHILTESLLAEEVDFLMGMDMFYFNHGTDHKPLLYDGSIIPRNDLFQCLLHFIGYFEKEMRIGTASKTSELIYNLMGRENFISYYQAYGEPWQKELDFALDQFLILLDQESQFWLEYGQRVNNAVKNEFSEVVLVKTKRKHIQEFKPHIESYSGYINSALEIGGQVKVKIEPQQISAVEPYKFLKKGDYWHIVFEGDEFFLEDYKGLHYIYFLLQNPHEEFHVLQLFSNIAGTATAGVQKYYQSMSNEQLAQENLYINGSHNSDQLYDLQALNEYKNDLDSLEEDIIEAENNHDLERVAQLKESKQFIIDEIKKSTGKDRKPRSFSNQQEKARKAVSNSISRVLSSIKKYHPSLFFHLRNSINTGLHLSYIPEKNIEWKF